MNILRNSTISFYLKVIWRIWVRRVQILKEITWKICKSHFEGRHLKQSVHRNFLHRRLITWQALKNNNYRKHRPLTKKHGFSITPRNQDLSFVRYKVNKWHALRSAVFCDQLFCSNSLCVVLIPNCYSYPGNFILKCNLPTL